MSFRPVPEDFYYVMVTSFQIQFPLIDIKAYPIQDSDGNSAHGDVAGKNEMHKFCHISMEKCAGAVAAGNQKEGRDDLIYGIKAESGKDTADQAVFLKKLSDGHTGSDPEDIQQDTQKRCQSKQREKQAGGHAEYTVNIPGKAAPCKAPDILEKLSAGACLQQDKEGEYRQKGGYCHPDKENQDFCTESGGGGNRYCMSQVSLGGVHCFMVMIAEIDIICTVNTDDGNEVQHKHNNAHNVEKSFVCSISGIHPPQSSRAHKRGGGKGRIGCKHCFRCMSEFVFDQFP